MMTWLPIIELTILGPLIIGATMRWGARRQAVTEARDRDAAEHLHWLAGVGKAMK